MFRGIIASKGRESVASQDQFRGMTKGCIGNVEDGGEGSIGSCQTKKLPIVNFKIT